MIVNGATAAAQKYLQAVGHRFERIHADELQTFQTITTKQHVFDNPTTKLYRENKYRLPMNTNVFFNLTTFLESNNNAGGSIILFILQSYCQVIATQRGPIDQYSFEAIISSARGTDDGPELQEGIPGGFTGVSNRDVQDNTAGVKLGMMPMEAELAADLRAQLEDEDARNPPEAGKSSLIEEYERLIKVEETPDGPSRNEIPFPPSRARDVIMEVQKMKESRDRFKIESRTGGVGPAVSVMMFTFHNTLDRYIPFMNLRHWPADFN